MTKEESTSQAIMKRLIKYSFHGIRKGSQWYALDGVTKINYHIYHKYAHEGDLSYLNESEILAYVNGKCPNDFELTPEKQEWIRAHQFDFGLDGKIIFSASEILNRELSKAGDFSDMSIERYNVILKAMKLYTSQF